MLHQVSLRGHLPLLPSVETSLKPALMTPLLLVRLILMPPPCSPIPTDFLGFVHVLRTYLGKLMTLLGRLPWSIGEMAHPRGWWEQ